MRAYGFNEAACKYGKLVVAFLAGMQVGTVV